MDPQFHPEADAILARLTKEGITELYHFTSVENLPGICKVGVLCSKQTLELKGLWPPPVPGGNSLSHHLDRYNDNWDKVSLSFTPFTPMAYRKKRKDHLCYLIARLEVASWTGIIFTDSNAASTTIQRRDTGLVGLNYIKFDAIRSIPRPWDRNGWVQPVQAEVLVPDRVPLGYISKVAFVSKASLMHAERLCGSIPHPHFSVDDHLFSDSPKAQKRLLVSLMS